MVRDSQGERPGIEPVKSYLEDFQGSVCEALEAEEGSGATFSSEEFPHASGGFGRPRILRRWGGL